MQGRPGLVGTDELSRRRIYVLKFVVQFFTTIQRTSVYLDVNNRFLIVFVYMEKK